MNLNSFIHSFDFHRQTSGFTHRVVSERYLPLPPAGNSDVFSQPNNCKPGGQVAEVGCHGDS